MYNVLCVSVVINSFLQKMGRVAFYNSMLSLTRMVGLRKSSINGLGVAERVKVSE